jgi:hypothetical protein
VFSSIFAFDKDKALFSYVPRKQKVMLSPSTIMYHSVKPKSTGEKVASKVKKLSTVYVKMCQGMFGVGPESLCLD